MLHFLYASQTLNIESRTASKKGNSDGSMGSKSFKRKPMKSYKNNKTEAIQKLKNQKKENALDIISKSLLNALCKRQHLIVIF